MSRINRLAPLATLLLTLILSSCVHRTMLLGPTPSRTAARTIWFVQADKDGAKLVPVKRALPVHNGLDEAVNALLSGPSGDEASRGLGSEIPRGAILLGLEDMGDRIELNLSGRFASGGGARSFELRLEQLSRTVKGAETRPVYLNVEGKRLNITQGEGIEVKQPINR